MGRNSRCCNDKGNQENLFDRVDYNLSHADSLHLNASYTRSWFLDAEHV